MEITYHNSVNGELAPIVHKRIEAVADLFPTWCHQLVIFMDLTGQSEFEVSCVPNYPYRWAQITIHPAFFDNPNWARSLLHEIHHIYLYPYTHKVEGLLKHWLAPEFAGYIQDELQNAEEAITQDLTQLISRVNDKSLFDRQDEEN